MPLSAGDRLGTYEILAPLGAGGMGEVYRARDTKLGRDVAVKILPPEVAQDPSRLQRFRREARLLASLNHPHIAAIHGLEEMGETPFLVLELVEGETLAQKLTRGRRPVPEALTLCGQVAEALAAAHEKGILHRDLKPSNVALTPEGDVKLLDFGLAKALTPGGPPTADRNSPTLTPSTREGTILGTTPYMSPEQARGEELDRQTDVWSFGCVLYETLSGERVFSGETESDTIAAILDREPDWEALPPTTPDLARLLLRQCLRKDRRRRLRDIADARIQIEETSTEAAARPPGPQPGPPSRFSWRGALPWTAAVLAAGLAGVLLFGVATGRLTPSPASPSVTRFSVTLPATQRLTTSSARRIVAISPGGAHIAYVADERLYLRAVNRLQASALLGTEGGSSPFFSPDGEWIGFYADGQLKKIPLGGGTPTSLCDASDPSGASWSSEAGIVFGQGQAGIWRVPARGGRKELLISVDAENGESAHEPEVLPGGRAVLFTLGSRSGFAEDAAIAVQIAGDPGSRRILVGGGTAGRYVPTGHVVFAVGGQLFGARFDLATLKLGSDPVPVVEGVMQAAHTMSQRTAADFSFSRTGTLVYIPARVESRRRLVWVDRHGGREPLEIEEGEYGRPRISPDGTRLAIAVTEQENADIWIFNLKDGGRSRLTFDPAMDNRSLWTPDGQRVVFRSTRDEGRSNMFWKRADGTGQAGRLASSPWSQVGQAWSPSGSHLVFNQASPETGWDIMMLPMEGPRTPVPLFQGRYAEIRPAISPNGRWIAYMSDETGRAEIYVRSFPDVDQGIWQVSTDGGSSPVWGPDGRELFYRHDQQMILVTVEEGPGFRQGSSRVLFTGSYFIGPGRKYDLSPDGKRFLMIEATSPRDELIVISNWFDELERLVPTS